MAVVLFFTLAVVVLLTRGMFSRDLTNALKRVTEQEEVLQEKANILEARIGEMEQAYKTKLKRAELEAERIIVESKEQAMNVRTSAIEDAKHRARALMLEAEENRSQLRTVIEKEMGVKIARRAGEITASLLSKEQMEILHERLVTEVLENLKKLNTDPIRNELAHVCVITGRPLSKESSQKIAQWVVASFGQGLPLRVEEDASLIAGCVVKLGDTTIDNCFLSRIARH